MSRSDDSVRALEDKDQIRELTARYCFAIADGDVEALLEMFCEDGVFVSERGRYEGRDELRGFYERVVEPPTNKPFIHNHLIEVDGDRASGRCAVEVQMVRGGEAYISAGYYRDSLARVDGCWLFRCRENISYYRVPLAKGWA